MTITTASRLFLFLLVGGCQAEAAIEVQVTRTDTDYALELLIEAPDTASLSAHPVFTSGQGEDETDIGIYLDGLTMVELTFRWNASGATQVCDCVIARSGQSYSARIPAWSLTCEGFDCPTITPMEMSPCPPDPCHP